MGRYGGGGAVELGEKSRFSQYHQRVIFQTGAFDAVWDGQFDMEPTENSIRGPTHWNGWDPDWYAHYYNLHRHQLLDMDLQVQLTLRCRAIRIGWRHRR